MQADIKRANTYFEITSIFASDLKKGGAISLHQALRSRPTLIGGMNGWHFILFRVGYPLTEDMNVTPRRSPVASGALTMFKIYELTKGYRPAFGGVAAR